MQKYDLTLMVGPSGAGKTTWLANYGHTYDIHPSHIISSDQLRQDLYEDFKFQGGNRVVFHVLHDLVKVRLQHNLPVVVDATNVKAKSRKALLNIAYSVSSQKKIRYLVIDRPLEQKRETGGWRNELTHIDLIGEHDRIFEANSRNIITGDGYPNIDVIIICKK